MRDMSSEKFPEIPRTPSTALNGWGTLVNKNGPEGSNQIIADAFTVKLLGREEEVETDAGSVEPGEHVETAGA